MTSSRLPRLWTIGLALLIGFAAATGSGLPALGQGDEPVVPAALEGSAAVNARVHYQGRLTDPGTGRPLEGTLAMTFGLYEGPTGGSPFWQEKREVQVVGGLFSVDLGAVTPLELGLFRGQEIWLGIAVGKDPEAAPRQRIGHSVYAFFAENAALLGGKASSAFAASSHNHAGEQITTGIVADARIASTLARDNEVFALVLNQDGPSSGLNADLLDGLSSGSFARTTEVVRTLSISPSAAYPSGGAQYVPGPTFKGGLALPDTGTPAFTFGFTVPSNYPEGGDMALDLVWTTEGTKCTIILAPLYTSFARPGRPPLGGEGPVGLNGETTFEVGDSTVSGLARYVIASPDARDPLLPGDAVNLTLFRNATEDRCTSPVYIQGIQILYK